MVQRVRTIYLLDLLSLNPFNLLFTVFFSLIFYDSHYQWVWAPLLDNLMAIGYDSNMIYFANYDWRLSRMRLEQRDGFWSRTKFEIELRVKMSGQKVVLMVYVT